MEGSVDSIDAGSGGEKATDGVGSWRVLGSRILPREGASASISSVGTQATLNRERRDTRKRSILRSRGAKCGDLALPFRSVWYTGAQSVRKRTTTEQRAIPIAHLTASVDASISALGILPPAR